MLVIVSDTRVYARPDASSFDWAHLPRGMWVRGVRAVSGWEQIAYEESDRLPDPSYTSYQIMGWVPAEALADRQRRSFCLLRCPGETPPEWTVRTDGHTFRLFWTPLDHLPKLVSPQGQWLRWLSAEAGDQGSD